MDMDYGDYGEGGDNDKYCNGYVDKYGCFVKYNSWFQPYQWAGHPQ